MVSCVADISGWIGENEPKLNYDKTDVSLIHLILSQVCGISASLIVNIFENNPEWVSVSGNVISDASDHFSQFCIFRSARDRIKPAKRKMSDFTNSDRDSFTQDLDQIDWQLIKANGNNVTDYIFSSFHGKYNKIIDKHVPIKQIS